MKNQEELPKQIGLSDTSKRKLGETLEQSIEYSEKELSRTHTSYWEARNDLAKTVITLASGSIVLTVTFSSSLINSGRVNPWRYLLFGSWAAFLISIITGILSLWVSIKLKKFSSFFRERKSKILEVVEKDGSSEQIIATMIEGLSNFGRANTWAGRFLNASLITFIVALLLLGLFGWQQFAA